MNHSDFTFESTLERMQYLRDRRGFSCCASLALAAIQYMAIVSLAEEGWISNNALKVPPTTSRAKAIGKFGIIAKDLKINPFMPKRPPMILPWIQLSYHRCTLLPSRIYHFIPRAQEENRPSPPHYRHPSPRYSGYHSRVTGNSWHDDTAV
jgi:hypothetical protein